MKIFIKPIIITLILSIPLLNYSQSDTLLANQYFHIADSLSIAAQYDSSNFYFRIASEIYKKSASSFSQVGNDTGKVLLRVQEEDLGSTACWVKYVQCCRKMGWNYLLNAKYTEAIEQLETGLTTGLERLDNHTDVAACYNALGEVYRHNGNYEKAMEYYQQALNMYLKTVDEDHTYVAYIYGNMGIIYQEKGDYGEAMEYYQQTLRIFLKTLGEDNPYVAMSYNNIGAVYEEKNDRNKAMEYYQRSLNIYLKILYKDHPFIAYSYNNIGIVYNEKGDYDKAMEYHQKALRIFLKTLGKYHPDVAMSYINIGGIYYNKGDHNKAIEYYKKSLNISLEVFSSYHPDVGECYYIFGNFYSNLKDYGKALQNYQLAIQSLVKDFSHSSIYINPEFPEKYEEWKELINSQVFFLETLEEKAGAFEKKWREGKKK